MQIVEFSPFKSSGGFVNTTRLVDLVPGSTAIISSVNGAGRVAIRLMEMGFVPGALVEVLRRAPFGGPVQYRVHGVSVSMRASEAGCVNVDGVQACELTRLPVGEIQCDFAAVG
jgi:ferrous iron transport protein A